LALSLFVGLGSHGGEKVRCAFLVQGNGELGIDAMSQGSADEALEHGLDSASRDQASGLVDERRIDANLGTNRLDLI
jgi:hypothetical protein